VEQLDLFKEKEVNPYYHITKIDIVEIWDPIENKYFFEGKGIFSGEYTLYKTGFTDEIFINDGEIFCGLVSNITGRVISTHAHSDGYMRVTLTMRDESGRRKENKTESKTSNRLKCNWHKLIALAFIKNDDPKRKKFVNHKNKKKYDNRLTNLEWVTPSTNAKPENIIRGYSENFIKNAREKENFMKDFKNYG
jgi:hypothetical protein